MTDSVVSVSGLGKVYSIPPERGANKSIYDTLGDVLSTPFMHLQKMGGFRAPREKFWALKDVSFEIKPGEVVGIVGRNGAGKSTLLKILSRITEPSEGSATIRGTLGALLEVGVGFHPDLTGRENIYLNGVILGMKKSHIQRLFDQIVAFAEVGKFIDMPMKHYSSGMYVRLAFAVAAHLEPQILVIDEVLAVGDAAFQGKCLGKIGDVAKEGRTVIFVSHNMPAVMGLCTRAILLESGQVVADGKTKEVLDKYLVKVEEIASESLEERPDRKGDQSLKFTGCELLDSTGRKVPSVYCGDDITLAIKYRSSNGEKLKDVHIEFELYGRFHESVCQLSPGLRGLVLEELPPEGSILLQIPHLPLQPGRYTFDLYATVTGTMADYIQNASLISVEPGDFFGSGKLPQPGHGTFLLNHSWQVVAAEKPSVVSAEK